MFSVLFAASKNSLSHLTLSVPDSVSLMGYMLPTSSVLLNLNFHTEMKYKANFKNRLAGQVYLILTYSTLLIAFLGLQIIHNKLKNPVPACKVKLPSKPEILFVLYSCGLYHAHACDPLKASGAVHSGVQGYKNLKRNLVHHFFIFSKLNQSFLHVYSNSYLL